MRPFTGNLISLTCSKMYRYPPRPMALFKAHPRCNGVGKSFCTLLLSQALNFGTFFRQNILNQESAIHPPAWQARARSRRGRRLLTHVPSCDRKKKPAAQPRAPLPERPSLSDALHSTERGFTGPEPPPKKRQRTGHGARICMGAYNGACFPCKVPRATQSYQLPFFPL